MTLVFISNVRHAMVLGLEKTDAEIVYMRFLVNVNLVLLGIDLDLVVQPG